MSHECSVDGCHSEHEARGYCDKHYRRFLRHGSPYHLEKAPNGSQTGECKVPGCRNPKHGHGYCDAHLQRLRRNGGLADQWGQTLLGESRNPNRR